MTWIESKVCAISWHNEIIQYIINLPHKIWPKFAKILTKILYTDIITLYLCTIERWKYILVEYPTSEWNHLNISGEVKLHWNTLRQRSSNWYALNENWKQAINTTLRSLHLCWSSTLWNQLSGGGFPFKLWNIRVPPQNSYGGVITRLSSLASFQN